jgi:septum formation protein
MEKPEDFSKLILASQSPRRRYMLKQAGLVFAVVHSNVDESTVPEEPDPTRYVCRLAELKAKEVSLRFSDSWVIGADTIVVIDGKILGKPDSDAQARSMLRSLSGKTHQVITGYSVLRESPAHRHVDAEATDVTFKALNEAEIDWYIRTGEPFDKAGAYAIQGIGTFLVKRINGSYTNVVGLPVCELVSHLIRIGAVGEDMTDRIIPDDSTDFVWI